MTFIDKRIIDNRLSWLNKTTDITPLDLAQCAAKELGVKLAMSGWYAWPGLYCMGHAAGRGRLAESLRGDP